MLSVLEGIRTIMVKQNGTKRYSLYFFIFVGLSIREAVLLCGELGWSVLLSVFLLILKVRSKIYHGAETHILALKQIQYKEKEVLMPAPQKKRGHPLAGVSFKWGCGHIILV